jgi:hypothetical protein
VGLQEEAKNATTTEGKMEMYDKLLMALEDAKKVIRDEIADKVSLSRSLSRSLARSLARPLSRSLAHSLARTRTRPNRAQRVRTLAAPSGRPCPALHPLPACRRRFLTSPLSVAPVTVAVAAR